LVQSWGSIVDNISILRLAAIRRVVPNSLVLALLLELLGPLVRVGISLLHESQPPFFRPSLYVFSSLREQVAQIDQGSFVYAQEHDAVDLWARVLLISLQRLRTKGFENDVRLKIVQNLVVSEV
jgi:hypothetical protein